MITEVYSYGSSLHVFTYTTGPFIKGVYMGSRAGIATVKMAWKLADGKPAMAYTGDSNVVPMEKVEVGTPVGLINSITKRECKSFGNLCDCS